MTTAILFDRDEVDRLEGIESMPGRLRGSMLLWVDLDQPSPEEARRVADRFALDAGVAEQLASPSSGPSFTDGGAYLHVTASAPSHDAKGGVVEIECVIGENWVVTAHRSPVAVLDRFAELAGGTGRTGEFDSPTFLAVLLEWVLDEHARAFDDIDDQLEEIDLKAMGGKREPVEEIPRLVELRWKVGALKRSLVSHRPLLLALAHPEFEALGDEKSAERFEMLMGRYEATLQGARDARDGIVGSFNVLIAKTSHRSNEIMKILTLTSVTLLPGALIAGLMGMNFKVGLFDHESLFWAVVAAVVAIAGATVAIARARDWI